MRETKLLYLLDFIIHLNCLLQELDINQENSEGDDILLETMQAQAAERIMDEVRKFEEHFQSTMNESQVINFFSSQC